MKKLAVLGSTGSVGRQALQIARGLPQKIKIVALSAGNNHQLLKQQVEEFSPQLVFSLDPSSSDASMEEIAIHPDVDIVLVATSGKAGLLPVLAAIRAGKTVALANKEVLVAAGSIVMAEAEKHGVEIKPVDSEHSAIWQCLQGEPKEEIAQILLTASGGPFRDRCTDELVRVTAEEALNHPTWQMGPKVTIDSANLMNKGMEVIEAHWLFGVPFNKIKVMVQPGSIIHSMVEFADGSVKAQLGMPDMRLPIQYAISHPERWENPELPKIDFGQIDSLKLLPVDFGRYPCLGLAYEAGQKGGTFPAVLSAADEIAVARFIAGGIGFLDIPQLLEYVLGKHKSRDGSSLDDILDADAWAREMAREWRPG